MPTSFHLTVDYCLGGIYQVDINSGAIHAVPATRGQKPYAVAYDPVNCTIYWSDIELNMIKQVFSDGNGEQSLSISSGERL